MIKFLNNNSRVVYEFLFKFSFVIYGVSMKLFDLRKAKDYEYFFLARMSADAFHSDVSVGMPANDGPDGYDSTEWHKQMQDQSHLYVFTFDEVVVGGAVLFFDKEKLYVGRIFVTPEYQRRGMGLELMNLIESIDSNVKEFYLDTPKNNIRTNNFYKKCGYEVVSVENDTVNYRKIR